MRDSKEWGSGRGVEHGSSLPAHGADAGAASTSLESWRGGYRRRARSGAAHVGDAPAGRRRCVLRRPGSTAVVGGGGLLQLPALLLIPGISPVQALATNKLASGLRHRDQQARPTIGVRNPTSAPPVPMAIVALIGSFGGAAVATVLPPAGLQADHRDSPCSWWRCSPRSGRRWGRRPSCGSTGTNTTSWRARQDSASASTTG